MQRLKHVLAILCGWKYASTKFSGNWVIYGLWLLATLLLIAQPLALAWEFREWGPDKYILMKLYPHQLLIPPMCFGFVFWAYGTAVSSVWAKKRTLRRKIIWSVVVACAATGIFLYFELTRTPLMLMELKPDAVWQAAGSSDASGKSQTISNQTLAGRYLKLALMNRGYDPETGQELNDNQKKQLRKEIDEIKRELTTALKYDAWKNQENWSVTRWLYAATFFLGIAGALSVSFFAIGIVPNKAANRISLIFKILYAFGGFGLWVTARIYFNTQIKGPVFGAPYRHPPWDAVLLGAIVIAAVVLALRWLPKNWLNATIPYFLATLLPGVLGLTAPECLDALIGVKSEPSCWFATFAGICLVTYALSLAGPGPSRRR